MMRDPDFGPYILYIRGKQMLRNKTMSRVQSYLISLMLHEYILDEDIVIEDSREKHRY